ncbi:hypothetical protein [Fervidibacter sacchari]
MTWQIVFLEGCAPALPSKFSPDLGGRGSCRAENDSEWQIARVALGLIP